MREQVGEAVAVSYTHLDVYKRQDRQIVLQLLERLLDLDQLQIKPPQIAGIITLDIGAQQITAFAPPGLPQFVPVQCEVECFGCDRLRCV